MLGAMFYPVKVVNKLREMGWTFETLPDSRDTIWGSLLRTLRKSGVSVELAAIMLDRALQADVDALEWVSDRSGMFGWAFFGTPTQWSNDVFRYFPKPIRY